MASDSTTTIASALIGAVVGSLGSQILANYLKLKGDKTEDQRLIVRRYLYQIQIAAEVLHSRITKHFLDEPEKVDKESDYMAITTLYSFATFLVYRRALELDGIYIQMEKLGMPKTREIKVIIEKFQQSFEKFNENVIRNVVVGNTIHYYDLVSFADYTLILDDNHPGVVTFSKFKKKHLSTDRLNEEHDDPFVKIRYFFMEIHNRLVMKPNNLSEKTFQEETAKIRDLKYA